MRVFLQERIGNLLMIRSFAAEEQTLKETGGKLREHQAARMKRNRFSNLCSVGFGAAMSGMYLLGVGWCGYGILRGTISFGTLTAITQLIAQVQSPFANLTGYLPRFYAMLASAERLMEAESFLEEPSLAEGPAGEGALSLAECQSLYQGLAAFGLRGVSFAYPPSAGSASELPPKGKMPPVLRGFSLEIRRGEIAAFTGQSGCGKSTALKLLMCVFRPEEGERYYREEREDPGRKEGAGRREQGEGALTKIHRRLFAYVPQGNGLMSGTIREVVSFSMPEAAGDERRLWEALSISCAAEFVSVLEEGLDTLLGERGTGLSEGQMQRLAIARAVFSGRPVLLLDEATSALDVETEKELLENLRRLTERTVVIVTHRPEVLSICDRVLHFAESGVEEQCGSGGKTGVKEGRGQER